MCQQFVFISFLTYFFSPTCVVNKRVITVWAQNNQTAPNEEFGSLQSLVSITFSLSERHSRARNLARGSPYSPADNDMDI